MPPEQVNRRGGHHPEDELALHPDEQAFHGRVPLEGRRTDDPAHAVRERHEPHDPKRSRGGLGVGLDLRVQAPIEERRTDEFRQEQDHLRITYDLWPDDLTRRSPTHRRASIHASA